jgi:hypothetical protein
MAQATAPHNQQLARAHLRFVHITAREIAKALVSEMSAAKPCPTDWTAEDVAAVSKLAYDISLAMVAEGRTRRQDICGRYEPADLPFGEVTE